MAQRNGIRKLRDLAYAICKTVAVWGPVIVKVGAPYPEFLVAYTALAGACDVFVQAADEVLGTGV